ncbi:Non-specific lipid-transfer protein 8 [Hirschfeldia incana]|nr:Non-specific lipid-transfer protein 8 [Hirschfeldia incana]
MSILKCLVIISVLGIFLTPRYAESTISCSVVLSDLQPCVSYLTSGSGEPPKTCCDGVKSLDAATTTSADKKAACQCIKSVANSVTVKPELAKNLASKCNASLPVDASSTVDCNTVG